MDKPSKIRLEPCFVYLEINEVTPSVKICRYHKKITKSEVIEENEMEYRKLTEKEPDVFIEM